MNKVMLIGNLGSDPEVRNAAGTSVCSFSLATRTRQKDDNGEFISNWFRVNVWGKQAETCASSLHKGDKVAVTGELVFREYTTRNGERRQSNDVRAEDVEFLSAPRQAAPAAAYEKKPAPARKTFVEDDEPLPF